MKPNAEVSAAPTAPTVKEFLTPAEALRRVIDAHARFGWSPEVDEAIHAGRAALAAQGVPAGFVMAPNYRGYANLGTGQYVLNHSAAGEPPEVIISIATEQEKAGRDIGGERDNPPGNMAQPDAMAVRLRFSSPAGLAALEKQICKMRETHGWAAQSVPAGCRVADVGFRWDGEKQQFFPSLLIEFDPVAANGGSNEKGWRDRDAMFAMLAAAPTPAQAQQAEQAEPQIKVGLVLTNEHPQGIPYDQWAKQAHKRETTA